MKPALLAVLLALCALPVPAEDFLYRSNSFGMLLERIAPYLRDQSDWVMAITPSDGGEVRRLYDKGREVRRWDVTRKGDQKTERELAGGVVAARRTWDAAGNLVVEDEYAVGKLSRRTLYTVKENRLLRVRVQKADGTVLYTEQYLYATNGALREVRRSEPGAAARLSAYVAGPAGLSEERNSIGGVNYVSRYDTRGRLVNRVQRRGDQVTSREDFVYRGDTDHLLGSVEKRPGLNEQVERRYDDDGRILGEVRRSGTLTTEELTWSRDDGGRATGRTRRTPAGFEAWKYTLDAEGKTTREEYWRAGMMEKVTIFGVGDLRTEDLYREDGLFLRVYYDGDKRLREEVYENGRLVRERRYK
jgi:hypothetical protein